MPLQNHCPPEAFSLQHFETACYLYQNGGCAGAYALFSQMREPEEKRPALLYNLALCHVLCGEWHIALEYLDQALCAVKKLQLTAPLREDETHRKLAALPGARDNYLNPMPLIFPQLSPAGAKECILRLLIDVCAELALWGRLRGVAKALSGKEFENVKRALVKAELAEMDKL